MHMCLFIYFFFILSHLSYFILIQLKFYEEKICTTFAECDDYVDNMPAGNENTFHIMECQTRTTKPLNLYYIINFIERVNHFQTLQKFRNEDPFFFNNNNKKNVSEIMFAFMDLFVNCMSIAWRWNAKRKRNSRLSFQVPLTTEKVLIELVDTRFGCIYTDTY